MDKMTMYASSPWKFTKAWTGWIELTMLKDFSEIDKTDNPFLVSDHCCWLKNKIPL